MVLITFMHVFKSLAFANGKRKVPIEQIRLGNKDGFNRPGSLDGRGPKRRPGGVAVFDPIDKLLLFIRLN